MSSRPQIIPSRGELKKKAVNFKKGLDVNISPEVLEKIEAVIESAKDEFTVDVAGKLWQMRKQFNEAQGDVIGTLMFLNTALDETLEIKGMGGLFGYPLMTVVAKSLNDFLKISDPANSRQMDIIGLHIDALYVILANKIMGDGTSLDNQVVTALHEVVRVYKSRDHSAD